ncbi:4Fe-4S binding protein [Methanothermococcus okinawensis]|uniref:4Fe-4S ferredoxin iron-sulfur binding domain-containing protein n=1 Tax=Methanothermococcus okinawensis (strain DSM 14208 / JCM 11175 / IH1) TaxID=647113 RepID=F8AL41_METOI|nr:4Fe-4S binding protein [Methanothermococcus okinawensis]AEH06478.1 4Fe-4S ferredoxin iron-sulfur binding domain-containing protein [Methanothermococcus okinawensis IH1]
MKKRIYYWVAEEFVNKPIISEVILKTKIMINILMAKIKPQESFLMLELNGNENQLNDALKILTMYGEVEDVPKMIQKNDDKCIDCGACLVHCPVKAITMNEDFKVIFDENECIGCKNCANVCPVKAINILDL